MFPLSFWTPAAEFESRLKTAEAKLLEIARRYSTMPIDSWELKTFDTYIPRSAVPCLEPLERGESKTLKMHCVQATVTEQIHGPPGSATTKIPLVNLHGYMNAGAYFYRNFGGLCRHFQTVYALDMLGWGLSSRVPFEEVKESGTIESKSDGSSSNLHPPIPITEVNTFLVPNAGHLLILQNPKLVNNCMIAVSGGDAEDDEMPDLMDIDESEELSESWLSRAREILKGR